MTCKCERTLKTLVSRAFWLLLEWMGNSQYLVSFEEEPEACQNGSN